MLGYYTFYKRSHHKSLLAAERLTHGSTYYRNKTHYHSFKASGGKGHGHGGHGDGSSGSGSSSSSGSGHSSSNSGKGKSAIGRAGSAAVAGGIAAAGGPHTHISGPHAVSHMHTHNTHPAVHHTPPHPQHHETHNPVHNITHPQTQNQQHTDPSHQFANDHDPPGTKHFTLEGQHYNITPNFIGSTFGPDIGAKQTVVRGPQGEIGMSWGPPPPGMHYVGPASKPDDLWTKR